jgi:hypothetical protein
MKNTITEDVVSAIAEALRLHAPDLSTTFQNLIRGAPVEPPEIRRGASIYATLTVSVSWQDGEPILRALEAIERKHGYRISFADRQINGLVQRWEQILTSRQESPQR